MKYATRKHTRRIISLTLIFTLSALAAAAAVVAPINAQTARRKVAARSNDSAQLQAQKFIDAYTKEYLRLRYAASLAEWESNTRIIPGDESNAKRTNAASLALSDFTGSSANVNQAKRLLEARAQLTPLQAQQLEKILYNAGDNPESAKAIVKQRIAAETKQGEKLYGYTFKIDGKAVTPNEIDDILANSTDLAARRKAWLASKEVGKELKDGLSDLQRLRNAVVAPLGYKSFNAYQVADYRMTVDEMNRTLDDINRELRPLYRELHTWARYELAKKYNQPVPDQLPADWLPNRWGQYWDGLVKVEGLDITPQLKTKDPEWIVRQAEDFYVSLGFPKLPASFYERSSLYPLAADSPYKKNTHASAWHLDLDKDIRSLMSVETNADWYETAHHELGHIYYYLAYTNPDVPPLLRSGANRAYHEAIGTMMGLASTQKPFLVERGLASQDAKTDEIQALMKEALHYVVYMPFAAGTMSKFESDLYDARLPKNQYNKDWWQLTRKYQGIVPPVARGEEYCDAATKTHINDDPAQYYDYALSNVLLFQLHDHIARNILHQNPHATNYYGNKQVGDFLKTIMSPGASRDWRVVLKEATGEEFSAKAMLRYFEPLMTYLKEQNKGRKYTLAEL